jgi:hypothetical protein
MKNYVMGVLVVFSALSRVAMADLSTNTTTLFGRVEGIAPCSWYQSIGSEHDPMWMCAQVQQNSGNVVEVVFSGSRDVAWYHSPKLSGEEFGDFVVEDHTLPGHELLVRYIPVIH